MDLTYLIIGVVIMFLLRLYFNSPTVIGAAGERRLSALLRRKLEGQNYRLFDDLTLPTKRGTTQIDQTLQRFGGQIFQKLLRKLDAT